MARWPWEATTAPKSDIDLIVVVDTALDAALAEQVRVMIATHACQRPTLGNGELSVITADTARHVPIPTPIEVHYSSQWHDRIPERESGLQLPAYRL